MRTRGAVLFETPGRWEVVDLDVEAPRQGELLVEMRASGLCHSDDHWAKGDSPPPLPFAGGHEGAGVVAAVGPNTPGWSEGDHVVMSFLPACGRCRWCASGQQNLCDMGRFLRDGCRADGSFRLAMPNGTPVAQMCGLSTFTEHTLIDVAAAVPLPSALPFSSACLAGCGVGTGWGSAVNSAEVEPGHTVIVMGIGGVGVHAVQGARHAGATHVLAVDPVAMKRDIACEVGATEAFAEMGPAIERARALSNGQGADSAIICTGVLVDEHVRLAFDAVRKAGTVVVTALGHHETDVAVNARELTLFQKRLQGSVFGASNPTCDIPRMLELYLGGSLKLDELVTRTYRLDDINAGYDDMHAGVNMRGVIDFTL